MGQFGSIASSIGEVFLFALMFGVALPAVFAAGVRAMAWGVGGDAETSHQRPHPAGRVVGIACFALVLAAISWGIYLVIITGMGHH